MDVLRATAQTRFPMVVEQLAPFWAPLPSPCLFLPPHPSPPLPLPGTIPPRAAGNPPVCWKASFTGTQQPFQTDMRFGWEWIRQASQSFRALRKWLLTGSGEGNTLTGKMFMPRRLETCKRGSVPIFQGSSSQTVKERVCLSWQTGQGLNSMFSIQITIGFGH